MKRMINNDTLLKRLEMKSVLITICLLLFAAAGIGVLAQKYAVLHSTVAKWVKTGKEAGNEKLLEIIAEAGLHSERAFKNFTPPMLTVYALPQVRAKHVLLVVSWIQTDKATAKSTHF